MPNVVVTVEYNMGERRDMALPLDVSCRVLASALAKALNLDCGMEEAFTLSELDPAGIRCLPQNATLSDAGILHGRTLGLSNEKLKEARAVPQGGAFLTSENGKHIQLTGAYTLIGRRDIKHNILPDLDLTELDTLKITSRRHACIEFDQKSYVVSDLGSSNGTWVNGDRLRPKESRVLKEGDEITFGRNGVRVVFRRGQVLGK